MDQLMVGFMTIMEPMNFLAVFVGVLGGMIIGAMPGLTAPMGVALLIPFTYGMAAGSCNHHAGKSLLRGNLWWLHCRHTCSCTGNTGSSGDYL